MDLILILTNINFKIIMFNNHFISEAASKF